MSVTWSVCDVNWLGGGGLSWMEDENKKKRLEVTATTGGNYSRWQKKQSKVKGREKRTEAAPSGPQVSRSFIKSPFKIPTSWQTLCQHKSRRAACGEQTLEMCSKSNSSCIWTKVWCLCWREAVVMQRSDSGSSRGEDTLSAFPLQSSQDDFWNITFLLFNL